MGIAVGKKHQQLTLGHYEVATSAFWGIVVVLSLVVASLVLRVLKCVANRRLAPLLLLIMPTAALTAIREVGIECSLWRNPDTIHLIMSAAGHQTFTEVSTDELVALMSLRRDLVILDARYEGAMNYGHIPGAIALPVNLTQQEVHSTMATIDRNRPIVLYCQSQGCHFSDKMAIVLSGFGFRDIRIYRPGWVGWREVRNHQSSE